MPPHQPPLQEKVCAVQADRDSVGEQRKIRTKAEECSRLGGGVTERETDAGVQKNASEVTESVAQRDALFRHIPGKYLLQCKSKENVVWCKTVCVCRCAVCVVCCVCVCRMTRFLSHHTDCRLRGRQRGSP